MNCFQLIKTVLDEAYAAIPGKAAAKDAAIQAELNQLSKDYKNLLQEGCLDYSDPCRRFAYIYRYTTSHANLVYSKINTYPTLQKLFDNDKLVVSCIGGGPGSDFLGIMKYCLVARKKLDLKCQILDRDPAWSESWVDVDEKVKAPFRISTSYQPLDVTDPTSWQKFTKHFNADFFTLIYFISEVYAARKDAEAYFGELLAQMKPGAVLLYIDNNDSRFTDWFDGLVAKANLAVVSEGAGVERMPLDEDKVDLEPYFRKFGPPKLKPDIAYRIVCRDEG